MNKEELAVLEFFSKMENLPLGLAVAEQMDALREQMNNRFWHELQTHLQTLITRHGLTWQVALTEDKSAPDNLVGLHCIANIQQPLYLQPIMEQQYLGGTWRIYLGLMWSDKPTSRQLGLPAVNNLKASLQQQGFKSNESFLAWRWTAFHPRRRDFLLRYAQQPEKMLNDIAEIFNTLLLEHRIPLEHANAAVGHAANSLTASLNQLRDELID